LVKRALGQLPYGIFEEFLSKPMGDSIWNPYGILFNIKRKLDWRALGPFHMETSRNS